MINTMDMKRVFQRLLMCTLLLGVPFLGATQSLDSLYQMSVRNNPELKAIEMEYLSLLAQEDQVSQLPNPQVGVGVPILRPETRLGPQMMMISATQMFPWFGTFEQKKEVVIQLSKAKYEGLTATKLNLFYQIKSAYYQLVFLEQKRRLYEQSLENYGALESIALSRVAAGQSSIADVLRVQTKIDEYEALIKQLENEKVAFKAQINGVINRSLESEVQLVDSIDYQLKDYDLNAYQLNIEQHHPMLRQLDYQIAASNSKLAVNQKMNQPTLGVGVDYSLVNPRTDANPEYNGRDILVPKVMVSIPIYRKQYQGVMREEKFNQDAMNYRKENAADEMLTRIVTSKSEYDNAEITHGLALKQTEKMMSAYQILLANYSADGKQMEDLLATQNELIQLKLKADLSTLNMGLAKAKIERLTNF